MYFSKNIQKNKFYMKRLNFCCCPIINLELSLGNYYIQCIKEETYDSEYGTQASYWIYLYNQFTDISEINLGTNIK